MLLEKRSDRNGSQERKTAGLTVIEKECVWMKAGVINFRVCEKDHDCFHCDFDRAMREAMDAQKPRTGADRPPGWAELMRKRHPGTKKPCGYYLMGLIAPPGDCPRDYQCDDCPVELELGYRPVQRSIEAARYAVELEKAERVAGFHVLENECVWMKAGIVSFRLCDNNYDCYSCQFDRGMRDAMEERASGASDASPSVTVAREPGLAEAPCIHHLTGKSHVPAECDMDYECYRCPVHRSIAKTVDIQPAPIAEPRYRNVAGYRMADGYLYHFGHTWVHVIHGECVRVGVDGFAGKTFGAADIIDIPQPGSLVKQGRVGCVMTRDGRKAPLLSPLTGRILALNREAVKEPETVCEDPYHKGWLFQMEPSLLKLEAQGLYTDRDSFKWMEQENTRLLKLMGPSYERLASTGGEAIQDLVGHFPQIGWDNLVRTFLRTKG